MMAPRFLLAAGIAMTFLGASHARAAVGIAPPAIYPANTWQGRTKAVIRVLDRLDAHIETVTIPVGGEMTFRTLTISVEACVSRPETLPVDAGALLHLHEADGAAHAPFDGWMLQKEPALATYGSALYDVRIVECIGDRVAPDAGPLPTTKAPQVTGEDNGGEADYSVPSSSDSGPVPLAPDSHSPVPLAPPSGGAQPLAPPSPL